MFLGREEHESLVGDLTERHAQWSVMHGRRTANGFFWRETFAAIRSHSTRTRTPGAYPQGDSRVRHWLTDLGYAVRTLRRAPTHLIVCVLTLGVALGGMAAVISVINPILIDPLPYPDASRLVRIYEKGADGTTSNTGFATFRDLAGKLRTIEQSAVVSSWQPTLTGVDDAERVSGLRVSAEYFRVLGIAPAIGQQFRAEQDIPGTTRVVMLSHRLWQRRFAGDSSIVGRSIDIEGTPHLVSGVMPSTFDDVVEPTAEIWRVLGYGAEQPWACRTCRHLRMIARLRPDIAQQEAHAEVDAALANLAAQFPKDYAAPGGSIVSLRDEVIQGARPIMLAVSGAILLILLLAIVNVANLQLTRTVRRGSEFAVRAALGAGRVQLSRQLLAEAIILVVLSLLVAVAVGAMGTVLLVSQLPANMPRISAIRFDTVPLAAMAIIAAVVTIVVGLLPAWRIDGGSLAQALRTGQRGVAGNRRFTRNVLVVTEVSLAFMLVAGATLLGRSLVHLLSVDPGFNPANVLTMEIQASGARFDSSAKIFAHFDNVLATVKALPGVVDAGITNQLPLGGNFDRYSINAKDKPLDNPELAPSADRYTISPGFATTMQLRLRRGRLLTDADHRQSRFVALVSASLARRIWGTDDVIGKTIVAGGADSPPREIVGVVDDVRHQGLNESQPAQLYTTSRQWFFADDVVTLVVRSSGDPDGIRNSVVDAVRRIDPTQPIMRVSSMDDLVVRSTGQRVLALTLFAAFGTLALLLAGAGLYGVLAGTIAERTREIGIRSALGASTLDVVALVSRQAMLLVIAGAALGVVGALAIGRYLQSLLFEVTPTDLPTLAAAALLALLTGAVATLVPMMRALRIQPTEALRAL
jgi:putative ABC transport system permease protein